MTLIAEYIWIDGGTPTRALRSKTRVCSSERIMAGALNGSLLAADFPRWGADGSSTGQAVGENSDIVLKPVRVARDPFRTGGYLVLCETFTGSGKVHPSNARARLRSVLLAGADKEDAMFGFEQEYTLCKPDGTPLGFPDSGYPAPQGPYYCGVGAGQIFGRDIYEQFLSNCVAAGLPITGANFEVMPGQAEVQVAAKTLEACDGIWFARWILQRTAEPHNVRVSLDAKPAKGDWNGAGMHTNFSTARMRASGGYDAIVAAADELGRFVDDHLAVYGEGYEQRLTGAHETCRFDEYRWGVADRTASVRIPRDVFEQKRGYLEDRRPNANACSYEVAARILRTVCSIGIEDRRDERVRLSS